MSTHRELEVKLEAPRGWEPPALPTPELRAAGVAAAVALDPLELDALYVDTAAHHLLRRGVTLRRRTGDDEPGWHLKLPAADGSRTEIQRPLDAGAGDAPPRDLSWLVAGLALGEPLVPVARLRTRRAVTDLRDAAGASLAVVARDRVSATVPPTSDGATAWEEIEVEATGGDDALVGLAVDVLVGAGAALAAAPSKLARVLPGAAPPAGLAVDGTLAGATAADAAAGDVVLAYLRAQVEELMGRDPAVRLDGPDAVHRARIATRRIRATLATFRPLVDQDVTEPLRDDLRWWGGVLGVARDAEVRRDRLVAAVDGLAGTLVHGPARADLVEGAAAEYRAAWRLVIEAMRGERYLAMLRALDAFVAAPSLTPRAALPAAQELPRLVRRSWRRVRRRHRAAFAAEAAHRDERLHELRKAAKRARYAAEAAAPAVGHRAGRFARRLDRVQDALGTHRDATVLADRLRAAAIEAPEPTFTYGVLAAGELARARHALDAHADAWRRASRSRVHGWTRPDHDPARGTG
ncbi:CYTH and CHAD domain-containing protein [Demequina silvatica]|uniref:CYTH and CHAD domain-containing protein n=1 Tax=Demequina silvatica TaxID=1638988 RepID=UPI000781480D|nr:CYTH and CHAD domain-containing protein [Demequina silvatica]